MPAPPEPGGLEADIRACRLCADRFAGTVTGHAPRPVPWLSASAPVLIAGQAPGTRVHASGRPFDDASGERLRGWLGVTAHQFWDRANFAFLPMAFCFPGQDAKGGDLPPPPLCAATWRARVLAALPQVRLTLLIGTHAQGWHLGPGPLGPRVRDWRAHLPDILPLPHPSWRNTGWLKRNPWFGEEVVPWLQAEVSRLLP